MPNNSVQTWSFYVIIRPTNKQVFKGLLAKKCLHFLWLWIGMAWTTLLQDCRGFFCPKNLQLLSTILEALTTQDRYLYLFRPCPWKRWAVLSWSCAWSWMQFWPSLFTFIFCAKKKKNQRYFWRGKKSEICFEASNFRKNCKLHFPQKTEEERKWNLLFTKLPPFIRCCWYF